MILRGGTLTGFAYIESLEEVRDPFGGGTSIVWKEVRVSEVNVPPRFRQRPAVPEDQAHGEGDHDSAGPGAVQIRSCGGGAGEPAFSPPGTGASPAVVMWSPSRARRANNQAAHNTVLVRVL